MTADKLIRFIGQHGRPARDNGDGTITVQEPMRGHDGVWFEETSIIPATLKAARDWLGY